MKIIFIYKEDVIKEIDNVSCKPSIDDEVICCEATYVVKRIKWLEDNSIVVKLKPKKKKYHKIKIYFSALASNKNDLNTLYSNLNECYPEFNIKKKTVNWKDRDLSVLFTGKMEQTSDNYNNLCKLTHHAEALYDCTMFEHVHVAICIDNKWFGGNHEKKNKKSKK